MNQHADEFLRLPLPDVEVFRTSSGHRLLVPRSTQGLHYVLEEIKNEPGRLIPCLLLPASWKDASIFVEMDEDGLRWSLREREEGKERATA